MKKLRNLKKLILLMIIITTSVLCYFGITFAKYVSDSVWNYYLKSKGFYFSSDYLSTSGIKNTNNQWNGSSVHFNIKNSLNDAVITNYDIDYTADCTIEGDAASYAECHLNGTNTSTQDGTLSTYQTCSNTTNDGIDVSSLGKTDCELKGYTWENQVATKDLYFDVVLTNSSYELKDVKVNITVTSNSPYRQTLTGDFYLHKASTKASSITMSYKNYTDYDRLIISNSFATSKCVSVIWDASKLLINADKSAFSSYATDSNGYINEVKFNIGAKKSIGYMFYQNDFSATYSASDFTITQTTGCN